MCFEEMVKRIKAGDKAAVEQLISRFRFLIIKYSKSENDFEKRQDLVSLMIIAFIEAARKYQSRNQAVFPGYISKYLLYVLYNYKRKESHLRQREGTALDDDMKEISGIDRMGMYVFNMDMQRALQLLTKEEQQLIALHLIYDYTWQEIGEKFNENKATLYSRYKKALLKLRLYFRHEYQQVLKIAEKSSTYE